MYNKTGFLIAVAAFAVSASGTFAFDASLLKKARLPQEQIEAFERAKELNAEGDKEGARNTLVEAGITEETLSAVRKVAIIDEDEATEADMTSKRTVL